MIKYTTFGLALMLSACATTKPATVSGECRVFTAPGEVIQGVRPTDKRWIAKNIEAGVRVCGWRRPK